MSSDAEPQELPERIGRYAVSGRIGAGGMGVVLAARDDRLGRRVAIKLVQPDLTEGSQGPARLLREARALAAMSHPNVVPIYEAGRHEQRVYLVMAYVDGTELHRYLKPSTLWREVLEIYLQAGAGLAAAHEAGIVHRDFKPSNVVVAAGPRALVLDFGLAGPAQDHAAPLPLGEALADAVPTDPENARLTRAGDIMGTPAYMAPEVLRGRQADERSDQFSFCVALYESLYEQRPFGGASSLDAIMKTMDGELTPPPPETRVPAWVWAVVSRGLSVRPSDRFASMPALLAALDRRRGPATLRWALAVAGVAAVGLFLALPASPQALCREADAPLRGTWDSQREAEIVAAFAAVPAPFAVDVLAGVRTALDDYAAQWSTVRQEACLATRVRGAESEAVLDRRMACLERARLELAALTKLLTDVDEPSAAKASEAVSRLPHPSRCAGEGFDEALPPGEIAQQVAGVEVGLADVRVLASAGKEVEAIARSREVLAEAERIGHPPTTVRAVLEHGRVLNIGTRFKESLEPLRSAYFMAVELDAEEVAVAAAAMLLDSTAKLAQYDAAEGWGRHALALLDAADTPQPRRRNTVELALARILKARGHLDEARAANEAALAAALAHWGPDSRETFGARSALANIAMWEGRWEEALVSHRRVYEIQVQLDGPEHPLSLAAKANIGFALLKKGELLDAEQNLREVVEGIERNLPNDSTRLATALNNLGGAYERMNALAKARAAFQRVYEIRAATLGPEHPLTAHPLNNMGNAYYDDGQYDAARDHFERARAILEAAHGPDHPHVSFPLVGLGQVARGQHRYAEAAVLLRRALRIREDAGASAESVELVRYDLVECLWELDEGRADALEMAMRALDRLQTAEPSADVDMLRDQYLRFVGRARQSAGREGAGAPG